MTDKICCGNSMTLHIPMVDNKFCLSDAFHECVYCENRIPARVEPKASVPVIATDGLLASMALRYRHDFGILPADEQRTIMAIMRQIHEEVVGKGFYKPEHEEKFKRALNYE